jgi:hypothetical protein
MVEVDIRCAMMIEFSPEGIFFFTLAYANDKQNFEE